MTQTILDQFADRMDWNDNSKIGLLCQYIDNQQCADGFLDFLAQAANDEIQATDL